VQQQLQLGAEQFTEHDRDDCQEPRDAQGVCRSRRNSPPRSRRGAGRRR
jgi:hypothetical protein